MEVSISEAQERFEELIKAVENGESIVITDEGKPVAKLVPASARRKARLGGMKDRVKLLPGWDDPIDEDRFLAGDL